MSIPIVEALPGVQYSEKWKALVGEKHLEEAIALIPDKDAYLEAVQKAPRVVETESNALHFLERENFDVWRAAQRRVRYWRERKNAFGPIRFFLPIVDLSGNGALNQTDIEIIRAGVIVTVATDGEGHSVTLFDHNRMPGPIQQQQGPWRDQVRYMFHKAHLHAQTSGNRKEGLTTILLYQGSMNNCWKRIRTRKNESLKFMQDIFRDAFPIKIKRLQVICHPNQGENRGLMDALVPYCFKAVHQISPKTRQTFCVVESVEEIREELKRLGLNPDDFPPNMGGQWSYARRQHSLDAMSNAHRRLHAAKSAAQDRQVNGFQGLALSSSSRPSATIHTAKSSTHHSDPMGSLGEALGRMPVDEKASLLAALKNAPRVVEIESDPRQFLPLCSGDDAAKRLCRYWKIRAFLFGDRALSSMTQKGDGALSRDDILFLDKASIQVLPDDSLGRKILFLDISHSAFESSHEVVLRCAFYCLSSIVENGGPCPNCVVIMVLPRDMTARAEAAVSSLSVVLGIFPIRYVGVHIFHEQGNSVAVTSDKQVALSMIQRILTLVRADDIHAHELTGDKVDWWERHGINPSGIPAAIGGSWKMEDFVKWQSQRVSQEIQSSLIRPNSANSHGDGSSHGDQDERKMMCSVAHPGGHNGMAANLSRHSSASSSQADRPASVSPPAAASLPVPARASLTAPHSPRHREGEGACAGIRTNAAKPRISIPTLGRADAKKQAGILLDKDSEESMPLPTAQQRASYIAQGVPASDRIAIADYWRQFGTK